jgi:hypothetical protein
MRKALIVAFAAILTIAATRTNVRADAVTDCAEIQGKAFVAVISALFKEGGRACAKGSAMNPLTISEAAIGAAVGKFYAGVGKGVDQSGLMSCFFTLENLSTQSGDANDFLGTARSFAKLACLKP